MLTDRPGENAFSLGMDFYCNISSVVLQKVLFANWMYWLLFSSSTTLLAHLFGKIDSFLLFCSSRTCAVTEGSKTARKNQFCQPNVLGKLLKDDPNPADKTFCKMTDEYMFESCIHRVSTPMDACPCSVLYSRKTFTNTHFHFCLTSELAVYFAEYSQILDPLNSDIKLNYFEGK